MSARLNRSFLRSAAIAALACSAPAFAATDDVDLTGLEPPAQPLHGTLNPFHGPLAPFHGTLQPFYGNVQPFWGTLSPFHGTLQPFWGTLNPFYADIAAGNGVAPLLPAIGDYWQRVGTQWQGKESLWTNPLTTGQLRTEFDRMIADGRAFWGSAVAQSTGKSFDEAFLDPLLQKNGIDPRNALTLLALSQNNRAKLFMEWYDGLMAYSGVDRVDHWMATANWRPSITQQQGSGTRSIIGLLDGTATGDPDLADNISYSGGSTGIVNGHGVGVASLMVAAHDGKGVMGIAPNATVVAYNPFDATNTASWSAIRQGVLSLASRNASVINMSLGQPGYVLHPTWRSIFFNSEVRAATSGRVFVMAAGNDGVSQTTNVRWDWSRDPSLILVGSVDPAGKISTFSNTPGNACLTDEAGCRERLMNRFMVAPGELILMPDGQGGFTRRSGTSFAAPLVAGAVTLMHDRWPWLANRPKETVDILLKSSKDLGAPGVDSVYGHGLLDVEASQAPLDFGKLSFYEVKKGVTTLKSAPAMLAAGLQTTWEAEGVHFNLYEPIGATFRDFSVPVSSLLVGRVGTLTGGNEYFQRFVEGRMKDWIKKGSSFTENHEVQLVDLPSLNVTAASNGVRGSHFATFRPQFARTTMRIANPSAGLGFAFGYGDGALALNGQKGLALASDHDGQGGVNPVLGLASGGAFAAVDAALDTRTTVSFGYTQQRFIPGQTTLLTEAEQRNFAGIDRFEASAINVRLTHRASDSLTLTGVLAQVRERNALLGVQSREQNDIGGGVTNTLTVTASLDAGAGVTLAASGTAGRTNSASAGEQGFRVADGVLTSAFAVSATKQGVLGRRDALRMSVFQPLHIETGALAYRSVEVIDRTTGQLGLADQRFSVAGQSRPVSAEMLYVTPLNALGSELGLFGRADVQPGSNQDVNRFAAGARLNLRFR